MIIGFRAGLDPGLRTEAAEDFATTRQALGLPPGHAPLARVFPASPQFGPKVTPAQVLTRLDAAAAPAIAAGMWPYLSLKPDPKAVIGGALDPHLTAIGRWCDAAGTPVYFSLWHEPENDLMGAPDGDDLRRASNFVTMHTRGYRIMKSIAGDDLHMGPCYMAYQWRPGCAATADGPVADAWGVPSDMRDFVGLDAYTSNWSWAAGTVLSERAEVLRAIGRLHIGAGELLVVERGISGNKVGLSAGPGQVQADILRQDYDWLVRIGAHGLLYWNSSGASDDSIYLLGTPARQIFLDIAADAYTRSHPPVPPGGLVYADGVRTGRAAAFAEVVAFAAGRA